MAIDNRSARGAILRPLALALGACLFAGMAHAQQPGTAPVAAPPTELPAGLPDYDADRALPELGHGGLVTDRGEHILQQAAAGLMHVHIAGGHRAQSQAH